EPGFEPPGVAQHTRSRHDAHAFAGLERDLIEALVAGEYMSELVTRAQTRCRRDFPRCPVDHQHFAAAAGRSDGEVRHQRSLSAARNEYGQHAWTAPGEELPQSFGLIRHSPQLAAGTG